MGEENSQNKIFRVVKSLSCTIKHLWQNSSELLMRSELSIYYSRMNCLSRENILPHFTYNWNMKSRTVTFLVFRSYCFYRIITLFYLNKLLLFPQLVKNAFGLFMYLHTVPETNLVNWWVYRTPSRKCSAAFWNLLRGVLCVVDASSASMPQCKLKAGATQI